MNCRNMIDVTVIARTTEEQTGQTTKYGLIVQSAGQQYEYEVSKHGFDDAVEHKSLKLPINILKPMEHKVINFN